MKNLRDQIEGYYNYFANFDEAAKKRILFVYRILAIPALLAAIVIFYDVVMPANYIEHAVVKQKYEKFEKGRKYYIKAAGDDFGYYEKVSREMYDLVNPGDTLLIKLSPILREPKSVELLKGNAVVLKIRGGEAWEMLIMGFLFLLPVSSLFKGTSLFRKENTSLLVAIPLFEFIAVVLIFKMFLVFIGVLDRI